MARILAAKGLLIALALGVSACGGASGGALSSAPPPAPAPVPSPAPNPQPAPAPSPPPLPSGPIGLQSQEPFATASARTDGWGSLWVDTDAVKIAYSATDGRYTVTLPEYQEGVLAPRSGNGSYSPSTSNWINLTSTNSDVLAGAGPDKQLVSVTLQWPTSSPFTYTNFGSWYGPQAMGEQRGVFAYGVPTPGSEIPRTGTATYTGQINGITNGAPIDQNGGIGPILDVFGTVSLSFDFGAGTLSGHMAPQIAPVWDAVSLGTYTFRDTIYSAGGRTFSGAFDVPGSSTVSSFAGTFTGPAATELMATWSAPFRYPDTNAWGEMSGVWIAKKGN